MKYHWKALEIPFKDTQNMLERHHKATLMTLEMQTWNPHWKTLENCLKDTSKKIERLLKNNSNSIEKCFKDTWKTAEILWNVLQRKLQVIIIWKLQFLKHEGPVNLDSISHQNFAIRYDKIWALTMQKLKSCSSRSLKLI